MSEKPHTVAIGAFVVGALLIAITIVIFALGSGFGQQRDKVIMVFDGSVKGLVIGAPVTLRGVQIGQITGIELSLDADTIELIMVVEAEISDKNIRRLGDNPGDVTDELISRGLRAQLKTQSLLTGLLYVQLDFHPDRKAILADIDSEYTQIPTIPTDLELLAREVEEIDIAELAGNVQSMVDGLTTFITDQRFQTLPGNLESTLASVTALSDQLRAQLASSGPKLDGVLDEAAGTLASAGERIPEISALAQRNLQSLDAAIAAFERSLSGIDQLVAPDSPVSYQLNRVLRELTLASKAIKQLALTLNEQPESLLRGKSEDAP